jgi:pimeloyl-ACP methyl ester carboxylesterase
MNTEIQDLNAIVRAADRRGNNVAMGGHSLGGSIATAYATWDFKGKPGGNHLSGLVLIDGASSPTAVTADQATASLHNLQTSSPWLSFGGIPAPLAGLFGTVGSAAAKADPNSLSVFSGWPLLPSNLQPPPGINPTNEAGFGRTTDVKTSPPSLIAAQVHSGQLAASGDPRGWDRAGNITPIQRWASMFSGWGIQNHDGTAWYHPMRLTIDSGAVGDGLANPAQAVLDVHSTDATKLRKSLKIYAFAAALGNTRVIQAAQALAAEARIPRRNLKLVNRAATYAHNDPSAAAPKVNAFLKRLIPFLNSISAGNKKTKKK